MFCRFLFTLLFLVSCLASLPLSFAQDGILLNDRFQVDVQWKTPDQETAMAAPGGLLFDEIAYFHFLRPDHVEVLVKVLEACNIDDHYWVFAAGLTDAEVTLTVTDTDTGISKTYGKPEGLSNFAPIQDTNAFDTCPIPSDQHKAHQSQLQKMIGLQGNRFQVQVSAADTMGVMEDTTPQLLTGTTAGFSLTENPQDPSVFVKIVDGTSINGSFWVYLSSITDRALTYTVTDTETGVTKTYEQAAGKATSFIDREFQKNDTHRWVVPWFSNNSLFRSRLVVNNYSPNTIPATLLAINDEGRNITIEKEIPAGGFLNARADELFGTFGENSSYLINITASEPGLVARWVTNNLSTASSGSPSQGVAIKYQGGETVENSRNARVGNALMFGYLPGDGDTLAAPVIVNLGNRIVPVTLYFFDANGHLLGTHEIPSLIPSRPFAAVVSDLLPGVEGDVSMVAYNRDQPLTGVVFTFNGLLEPSLGNAQAVPFVPPGRTP